MASISYCADPTISFNTLPDENAPRRDDVERHLNSASGILVGVLGSAVQPRLISPQVSIIFPDRDVGKAALLWQ